MFPVQDPLPLCDCELRLARSCTVHQDARYQLCSPDLFRRGSMTYLFTLTKHGAAEAIPMLEKFFVRVIRKLNCGGDTHPSEIEPGLSSGAVRTQYSHHATHKNFLDRPCIH